MGMTKIFIRLPKTLFETEDAFQKRKNELVSKIQAIYKGIRQRRKYLEIRKRIICMQVSWLANSIYDPNIKYFVFV